MPFGGMSTWDHGRYQYFRYHSGKSPMPFGGMSTWDTMPRVEDKPPQPSHQCLSAGCPLGTPIKAISEIAIPPVTNAFRRDVHLGPYG